MQGTSEVYNWDYKDKNNLVYVGSVVTWSYNQLENVKNYINMNKKNKPIVKKVNKVKKVIPTMNRESKIINDVEDF